MTKLSELHLKYKTDKGTDHSYIDLYDLHLEKYRDERINFLEIGCLSCESLKMFNQYFKHATIYGIDDWSQTTDFYGTPLETHPSDLIQEMRIKYPNIKLITCNSKNEKEVDSKITQEFDVIIDDGDHSASAQIQTMINFLPKLKQNGIYFIEDVLDKSSADQIESVLKQCFPNRSFEFFSFMKNNRIDDNIIIIK